MRKIDPVVLKETKYISIWVLLLSTALQAVFLVIGKWDYTVLLGNVLSGAAVILNFLMMGLTVQRAVEKEEKEAKQSMRASSSMRTFFLFAVTAIGVLIPIFSIWTVIIPLFFPRIAIAVRPFLDKRAESKEGNDNE